MIHVDTKIDYMIFHLFLLTSRSVASTRLEHNGPQLAVVPRDYREDYLVPSLCSRGLKHDVLNSYYRLRYWFDSRFRHSE